MDETPLPFHQHNVRVFRRLEHQLFGGTTDEIRYHGIDGNSFAINENSGLSGAGKRHPHATLSE